MRSRSAGSRQKLAMEWPTTCSRLTLNVRSNAALISSTRPLASSVTPIASGLARVILAYLSSAASRFASFANGSGPPAFIAGIVTRLTGQLKVRRSIRAVGGERLLEAQLEGRLG